MATTVYRTPFSIGYVEQAYSQGLLLPFAAIRNQAGNYVTPSTQSVADEPRIAAAPLPTTTHVAQAQLPIPRSNMALRPDQPAG